MTLDAELEGPVLKRQRLEVLSDPVFFAREGWHLQMNPVVRRESAGFCKQRRYRLQP